MMRAATVVYLGVCVWAVGYTEGISHARALVMGIVTGLVLRSVWKDLGD